jgi:cobalt-zinc-cadmium efflux system protein
MKGRKEDLNIKGAFLHMAADAGVSLGVVLAGFIIYSTGWLWVDPAISLIIVLVITIGTWGLLRDSFHLSIDAVPNGINLKEVGNYLKSINGVKEVHDLHIWAMSTTETALTAHLVIPDETKDDYFLKKICGGFIRVLELHQQFKLKNLLKVHCEHHNSNSKFLYLQQSANCEHQKLL